MGNKNSPPSKDDIARETHSYGYMSEEEQRKKQEKVQASGTDRTYHVNDMLKECKTEMKYDPSPPRITKEDLPVPGAFILRNVLTVEECKQYIAISEEMGFEPSPLRNLDTTNSDYAQLNSSVRNSERVLFDAPPSIANTLNERKTECEHAQWRVVKPNEIGTKAQNPINNRWRFNKYKEAQYFKPHFDAGFVYSTTEKTLFTFILYLNDGFIGGETIFFPENKKFEWEPPVEGLEYAVKPEAGMALIFFQAGSLSPRHEGAEQKSKDMCKYILRSDLAYVIENDHLNLNKN